MGYNLEEWAYIKNMPQYLLVKKIKTEEELDKKRKRRDEQRKIAREEKRKERESRAMSEIDKN